MSVSVDEQAYKRMKANDEFMSKLMALFNADQDQLIRKMMAAFGRGASDTSPSLNDKLKMLRTEMKCNNVHPTIINNLTELIKEDL